MKSKPPEPKALLRGHRSAVNTVSFLYGSNNILASGDVDGDVLIWNVETKRPVKSLMESHLGGVLSISSSQEDTRWISQGRTDGCVKLWNGEDLLDVIRTDSESFCKASVIWDKVDHFMFACTNKNESVVAIWDSRSRKNIHTLVPHGDEKWGMAMDVKLLHVSEKLIVFVLYEDGKLRCFDVGSEKQIPDMTVEIQKDVSPGTSFVLSPSSSNGQLLEGLGGGSTNELCSFSLDFQNMSSIVKGYLPAYHKMAMESDDETISKLGTGVGQIAIRPDSRICAIASWDHRVRILHFRTGKHVAVLKHHRGSVYSVAFSNDSMLLASGSMDQNIAIWSIYPPT